MPELPEVETVVRGLRSPLIGRTIIGAELLWARTLHSPTPDIFTSQVAGQSILDVSRRAKYIVITLNHFTLLVHLKMTGRLYVVPKESTQEADRWLRVSFDLDNDEQLRFSDARKFGKLWLTDDSTAFLAHLGPEPLDDAFTVTQFSQALMKHKKAIKALLLDQNFIAGVGNIYADEALFRAKIHPQTPSNCLAENQIALLYQTVRDALWAGIDQEGASINWYRKPDGTKGTSQDHFLVYGREGLPCLVCGNPIDKIRVAQRGTHFCGICQPLPYPLSLTDKG